MSMPIDGMFSQYAAGTGIGTDIFGASTGKTTAADKLQSSLENKDYSKSTNDELMNVCKEFESYFVEQVFKALEKMVPENEDKSSTTSSYMDYFGDMLTQEYAAAATESDNGRGLGIAQMLYEQMKRNYNL